MELPCGVVVPHGWGNPAGRVDTRPPAGSWAWWCALARGSCM